MTAAGRRAHRAVPATVHRVRVVPSRELELACFAAGDTLVLAVDEAGRGSAAGPVSVGVVVVPGPDAPAAPPVRDSKQLSPAARAELFAAVVGWVPAWAVGHASAEEIDTHGMSAALALAGNRAIEQLGLTRPADRVLLDGPFDWLRRPRGVTRCVVKGDASVTAIAAASVLVKVTRDALLDELDLQFPGYGLAVHKGYLSPAHLAALRELGPSPVHRRSWRFMDTLGLPREGRAATDQLDLFAG